MGIDSITRGIPNFDLDMLRKAGGEVAEDEVIARIVDPYEIRAYK